LRPTGRGWRIAAIAGASAALSIPFSDQLLGIIPITSSIILAIAFANLLLTAGKAKNVQVEPSRLDVKVRAGESRALILRVEADAPLTFNHREDWLRFESARVEPPAGSVRIIIGSPRSGVHRLSGVRAELSDFIGCFKTTMVIPLEVNALIYPRALPWIVAALRLIGEGSRGVGERPGRARGRGLEFLWSREYQIGDPFTHIDWKATARLQKIIVKEYAEEVYGAFTLIYDVRSHGPITMDESASQFLSSIISLAQSGLPFNLIVKNGDKVVIERENLSPIEAVKLALAHVVEYYARSGWNVYELVEPKASRALANIVREIGSQALREIAEFKLEMALESLRRFIKEMRSLIIYTGCILVDSEFVKELAAEVARAGGRLTILTPPKPWLDASGLEEAYLMYQSHRALVESLRKVGVGLVFGTPAGIPA